LDVAQVAGAPLGASRELAPTPPRTPPASVTGVPRSASSTDDEGPVRFRVTADWTALIFPIWLSGVAAILLLLAVAIVRIMWLHRVTALVQDERWLGLVEDLSLELGLTRHVRLLQVKGPAMPMTWGIRRPAILLPAEADEWTAERRRDVLLHELAHVKRHDFLIQLIARIACAVYWFHPL